MEVVLHLIIYEGHIKKILTPPLHTNYDMFGDEHITLISGKCTKKGEGNICQQYESMEFAL